VIFDSAGAEGQAFSTAYMKEAGRPPGWIAAGAYGAARLLVEALRRAQIENRPETREADRERVRAELAKIDSPDRAVAGLAGPLYFDSRRDMPRPVRIGYFRLGRFITAPEQLVLVQQPELIDLREEIKNGHVVSAGDRHYWRQRVVYTGLDINRVNRVDVREGTFNVDFYLWMRFGGDGDAPTRVEFPALLEREAFDAKRPLETGLEDGLQYRLYRIIGDFKANYDLHDYPFDVQQLVLRFQNTAQRRELIAYVLDSFGLRLADDKSATADDSNAYAGLPLWHFHQLRYFVDTFSSSSTLGKASLFGTKVKTDFAGMNVTIVLRRDFGIFVLKLLLPLLLLVLVVYATLFFPETLFRERISIPVTSILTSAVLLIAINGQLGDVGYTVAIEIIFYVFFGLCLMTMLAGFMHERLRILGRPQLAAVLDRSAQVLYPAAVIALLVLFYVQYGAN
jgi:hypothetical protein